MMRDGVFFKKMALYLFFLGKLIIQESRAPYEPPELKLRVISCRHIFSGRPSRWGHVLIGAYAQPVLPAPLFFFQYGPYMHNNVLVGVILGVSGTCNKQVDDEAVAGILD